MKFIKKAINWFTEDKEISPLDSPPPWIYRKLLDFFLPLKKRGISLFPVNGVDRPSSVLRTFGLGLFLGIAFIALVYILAPPEDQEGFWKKIFRILENYPTIILVVPSLPVAFVLWLFRNRDISMDLNLQLFHEAVRNIHNKKGSEGLRQLAFESLMEARKLAMWEKKINLTVFRGANLNNLLLTEVNLQGIEFKKANLKNSSFWESNLSNSNLCETNLQGAHLEIVYLEPKNNRNANEPINLDKLENHQKIRVNLQDAKLMRANLKNAHLDGVELNRAWLTKANLTKTNLTGAILKKTNLHETNLTETILKNTDLEEAVLFGAYYYKDKEARQKDERTPVTKKWLRERGAKNVDTVIGIVESTNLTDADLQRAYLRGFYLYKIIFTRANLTEAKLNNTNLTRANLSNSNLTEAELINTNLTDATLTEANLTEANLTGAYYYKNLEAEKKDERTAVTKRWLKEEQRAKNVDTVTGIIEDLNLTEVNLQEVDLGGFFLTGAYYYKNEEARQKDERTPVTKRWLKERGAVNVNTVYGIPEE